MQTKLSLNQEQLKLIACITMLIDHIGAILVPNHIWFRVVGRLSFPIFAFLLVEGSVHTKNPNKYMFRLVIAAVLSERIYDLTRTGYYPDMEYQNIMVTLLLGFIMLQCIKDCNNQYLKIAMALPFMFLNDILHGCYESYGIVIILMFALTRNRDDKLAINGIAMLLLGILQNSIQLFAATAAPIIALYNGEKTSNSKAVQIGFYLFYPIHLWLLYFIS